MALVAVAALLVRPAAAQAALTYMRNPFHPVVYEPTPNHAVVKIPYAGGQPKVLVKNGFEPDWSL